MSNSAHTFSTKLILHLLLLALLAWAGYEWIHTMQRVIRFYNPLPVEDYWRVPEELNNYQHFNVRALWRQHNEHRIIVPEIFFGIDMLLFHGEQLLPLMLNVLCYLGCWSLLLVALNSEPRISATTRRFAAVLSAILIGWPGTAFVLSRPFLLNWTLMQFAACLSFVFLWRRQATSRNAYLWGAIFAAVTATYSSGNAILLWPVLLIAAVVLALPKSDIIALAFSGLVSTLVYFIGYKPTGTLHFADLIRHPVQTLGFVCAYLSMPLGAERPAAFTVTAGFICIALTFCLFWLAWRNRLLQSAPAVLCFGFFVLVTLTALLTAAGRMDVTYDKFFFAARPVRYVTLPLLNWAVLVAVGLWIADRIRSKKLLAMNIGLTATVLLLLVSHRVAHWVQEQGVTKADQQLATLDIENGVADGKLTKSIFPNVSFINRYSLVLRKYHLSIYHNGPAEWLGKPLPLLFKDFGPPQSGKITFTSPVQGGLELAGIGSIPDNTSLTDPQIVFANGESQVVGFGRRFPAGVPSQLTNAWPPAPLQWVGFVNYTYSTRGTRAFLVSGSKLFPLDIAFTMPEPQIQRH